MRSLFHLAAALVLVTLVAGCSKGHLPPDITSPDDLAINSISPSPATKLAPGSQVTISAQITYILASKSTGTIVVNVQDQSNVAVAGSQASVSIKSGQSVVPVVTPAFTVPATGVTRLAVFYSLLPEGATSTSIIAEADYTVGM
jgi:hypothetical protein